MTLNHNIEKECWVIVTISYTPNTLLYLDVVEEALCFGWIDSTKKKNKESQLLQRLSPRTTKSSWTELNKQRVYRLETLGLMTEAGWKAMSNIDKQSFAIDKIIEDKLKEDDNVYENFMKFPELYRRIRIDTIQQVRNQPELYKKRLDKFLESTKNNKMYGAWNDNGRLV